MADRERDQVLHQMLHLAAQTARSDRDLLDRFLIQGDESAFAALVERHGSMVLGLCRRLLRNAHDAEDACQATFLVLACKADSVRKKESLASFLHGVAYHVAANLKRDLARRSAREARVPQPAQPDATEEMTWRELRGLLDEELARLPEHYRSPLVLCYLEGKTKDEAARQLGWGLATLRGRLERGRERLRARLSRRGVALSATLFTFALVESSAAAAVPAAILAPIARAGLLHAAGKVGAAAGVSARVAALTEAALLSLFAVKAKTAVVVLAVVVTAAIGIALAAAVKPGASPNQKTSTPEPPPPEDVPKVAAVDWPQWRGPNRDGVVQGVTVPAQWPKTLREEWQAPVGEGVASPVVAGGNVFVSARQGEAEVVLCCDVATGKEIWRSEPSPAAYQRDPLERDFPWPRSTPAVADGKVYVLGMSGVLTCLDARTGKRLWRKECAPPAAQGAPHDYGGTSPLVADGLCIVRAGGLTAFDARTGEVKWSYSEGYGPMSGSPILADLAGAPQVVTYFSSKAVGVSATTGKKLWTADTGAGGAGQPHTTPLRYGDLLLVADILQPLRALRLEKGADGIRARDVWKAAKDLRLGYSSPVLAGELVFGMSSHREGCFFCLDARSGKTLWASDGGQGDYASVLNAGSVWLVLTERGRLIVVKPSATTYEPIAEYRVSDTDTHAHPVFLGERFLIKDRTTLRCLRIEPEG